MKPKLVGVNLTFIEARPLTGPGYHAVEMFEQMVAQLPERPHLTLRGYAQASARHHFSDAAAPYISFIDGERGRIKRVLYEQFVLPWRTRADKVDLLLSPSFVSPLFGAPKLAAHIYDMYYRVEPQFANRFQYYYWGLMIPATARVSKLLLTISENSRRDIIKYLGVPAERVVVTPCGSRLNDRSPRAGTSGIEGPFLLMVANLMPNKNVGVVVDAVKRLRARGLPLRLIHVGSDPVDQLKHAIAAHDATAFVEATGKIDNERLVALYQDAFALVVASLYEGFCMPIVEAQSVGGMVISSNSSCLPEVAGEGALFFDPHDPDQLVDQVVRLEADPALRGLMIERGRTNAARMTWSHTARLTYDALEKVLAG
ncbi:glycosyltransferase family 1 protein [Sphingomonas sp.]|uniref:glycosyltransferase family 4 protein n=1 Tax=Sphingomonas sp. TaxID=28214 RepID=UPI0025DBDB06|nr:glycosyltransferase family 1 protein [Sphingomonas sp.]